MKLLMALLVVMFGAFAVFPQSNEPPVTDKIVMGIDRGIEEAISKGDTHRVDQLLGFEYIEITAQGLVRNKSDVMALVRARASAPKAIAAGPEVSVTDVKVQIYGDVAVIVGFKTTKYPHMDYQVSPGASQLPPPDFTEKERFMKVYVRRSNVWRRVASQTTNVAAMPSRGPDKPFQKSENSSKKIDTPPSCR